MLRLLEISDLTKRKRMLVAQSDVHRQTMRLQVAVAQETFAHFKKRFTVFGMSSAAVGLGASLAGFFFKKRAEEGKRGIIAKVLSGVSFFSQIKSFINRFKTPPDKAE
jgi:hypothetical protein